MASSPAPWLQARPWDPCRDMPHALLWAIGAAAIVYFGRQTVSFAVLPDLASTERPLVAVSGALFGPIGAVMMTIGMAVSVGGNLVAALLSTLRIT